MITKITKILCFGGFLMRKKHPAIKCMILVMIGSLLLLACIGSQAVTATVAALPTNTLCAQVTWTPPVEQRPVFYFFLIDGTQNYFQQHHVDDANNAIKSTLSEVIQSGDRVVLGWINDDTQYFGIEKTIFFNDVFVLEFNNITPTPTFPPTLKPFDTPTVTPTSAGQLRQTEVAKTVDAVKLIEQEAIQKALNDYACQQGRTITEIDEITRIIENLRIKSATVFTKEIFSRFPPQDFFDGKINNPLFESISQVSDFINSECNLITYSNCMLFIFSDLDDFRQNYPSDMVPLSNMAKKIDVLTIIYNCQFATGCEKKINNWSGHFSFFESRSFSPILNSNADKPIYNETISEDLIDHIQELRVRP